MLISEEKPWLKHYPLKSREMTIPCRTIYEAICEVCSERRDASALYFFGKTVSYAELLERIDTLADAFYGIGVREGDLVSFVLPTTPESICSLYALSKIGATANFIDPRMDKDRILDAASDANSKLLVILDLAYPKIMAIRDKLPVQKIVIAKATTSAPMLLRAVQTIVTKPPKVTYSADILHWKDLLALGKGAKAPKAAYKEGKAACITYTGGTTGTPKGVMLGDDGLNVMAESFRACGADIKPGDRFLEIMPIFASYGVGCGVHMPLVQGWELVVIPKFVPAELAKLICKYKPNHMMAVPSFYEQVMSNPIMEGKDLSFLKTTGCGGETMNAGLEGKFNKFLHDHGAKYPLSQGYGMSEMSGAATACFSNVYKDASAGIPLLQATAAVFDPETNKELGYNESGEICMTGRSMMYGYYHNPEETDQIMRRHEDGTTWIHSGDIGFIDEDGFVFIKGRIKQIIIKFDGHKVFPVSIEAILNKQSAVAECAVVGIPDPDHAQGEVPLGVVRLNDPAADKEAVRKELLAYCNERCEERGRPADIVFVEELPYTALNKHDYRKLEAQFKDHKIRA